MAIYGHIFQNEMARGKACHIYLNREQRLVLDAIGAAMGRRRLGVAASRSHLILTAIRNFIEDCLVEEDLKEAIEETRKQLAAEKGASHAK